jgi:hypothetical protein
LLEGRSFFSAGLAGATSRTRRFSNATSDKKEVTLEALPEEMVRGWEHASTTCRENRKPLKVRIGFERAAAMALLSSVVKEMVRVCSSAIDDMPVASLEIELIRLRDRARGKVAEMFEDMAKPARELKTGPRGFLEKRNNLLFSLMNKKRIATR